MFSDTTIVIINATSIILMLVLMLVLVVGTRMKGGAGWAAVVIVSTTVPVYLANTMRELHSENYLLILNICLFLNTLCFPSLWFFVRNQFDKTFHFTYKSALHFIPAFISLGANILYYAPMSSMQVDEEILNLNNGGTNFPAIVNDLILFSQFFIYFTIIFFYIRRRKQFFRDNYSDSDYFTIRWIPSFLIVFFVLFFSVFIAYMINPRIDAWLVPILNTLAVIYLIYVIIFHSTQPYLNRLPEIQPESPQPKEPPMCVGEMKEVCDKVIDYLKSSQAYLQQDLSLAMLVKETGIPQKTLSRSINGYLKRNFFDLVNEMRVEEAKRRLLELKTDGYKIDSIYEECGFRTRSTFFIAFKKVEGETPAHWLKMNNT